MCASVVLPKTGRAEQQRVIERLAPLPRRSDEDLDLRFHARLADVLRKPPRAHGAIERFVLLGGERRYDAASLLDVERFAHRSPPVSRCTRFSASRIISSVLKRPPSRSFSIRITSPGL